MKSAGNVKATLKKGTTGDVLEVKKFSSGNSGIKIKITNGPRSGESYWVYYNKKDPAIKLKDGKNNSVVEVEKLNLKDSPRAEAIREVAATRDLGEQALVDTARDAQTLNSNVSDTLTPPVLDCPPK